MIELSEKLVELAFRTSPAAPQDLIATARCAREAAQELIARNNAGEKDPAPAAVFNCLSPAMRVIALSQMLAIFQSIGDVVFPAQPEEPVEPELPIQPDDRWAAIEALTDAGLLTSSSAPVLPAAGEAW